MTFLNQKSINLPIVAMGVVCFLYLLPYYILGTDSHIMIWDNLDSNVAIFKVLSDSGKIFSPNTTHLLQIFNGIDRGLLPSELNCTTLLYNIFSPYTAYVIDRTLMTIIGFTGMYLLVSKNVIKSDNEKWIAAGVACGFAVLPFWPPSLSIAGTPLLLYSFLNIRSRQNNISDWLIISIYPFCASLITTGFFFLIVMTAIFVFDIYQTRKINWLLFLGLALVSVLFICSHYRLFISYFIESGYKSHRIEFYGAPLNHFAALKSSFLMLLRGQPHAYSLQTYIIIPVVLLASILMCKFKKISKPFLYVVIFLIITSLFYGFWQWSAFANIHSVLTAIIPIQLDRFYWLHPMFWFIAFGIALYEISIRFRIGKYITLLAICLQILYGFYYHENFQQRNSPTYKSFYATAQFLDIKKYINLPLDSYRVVSVGLYPSIALFNGFYVLDGYFPDYPLSYKHKFRKVILSELEKNTKAKEYFDWWGSRAYIFSSELMHNNSQNFKGNNLVIKNLDLNYSYLHSIGCRYVISSVKIDTALNNSLFLLKKFDDSNSAWDIYLYKIKV